MIAIITSRKACAAGASSIRITSTSTSAAAWSINQSTEANEYFRNKRLTSQRLRTIYYFWFLTKGRPPLQSRINICNKFCKGLIERQDASWTKHASRKEATNLQRFRLRKHSLNNKYKFMKVLSCKINLLRPHQWRSSWKLKSFFQ